MNEAKRDLIFLGALVIIVLIVGTGSYFSFRKDEENRKHLTAEVPANITDVSARRDISPQTGQTNRIINILVSYNYVIDGKKFERSVILSKDADKSFKVGQHAKVCYNPQRYEKAELVAADYNCGR